MLALVVFGRLSDHLGRRLVSIIAVVLAAAGCLSLFDVTSLAVLVPGRILLILACGLGSSAVAAYIIDLAPERPRWLAATTAAGAPLIGLTIGAVGSGALAEYGPAREQTPYLAATLLLAVCAVLLLASPEAVTPRPGALASLRPHVHLPRAIRPLLPAAIAVFCGTWALGGFYQAFSPTISAENLGTSNTLVAGIVFASFMAPYAFGGPLTGCLAPLTAQRAGIIVVHAPYAFGGPLTGRLAPLTAHRAGIIAGAAQGAAFTGSMRALLARTSTADRAGLMSTVYLFSYGSAAIPSLISGRLTAFLPLGQISLGYAALAVIAALIVLVFSRPGRGTTTTP